MMLKVLATMIILGILTVGPSSINPAVILAVSMKSAQLLRGLRHCPRLKEAGPKIFGTLAGMVRLTPEPPYRVRR